MASIEQTEKVITMEEEVAVKGKGSASPVKRKSEASESALVSPTKKQMKSVDAVEEVGSAVEGAKITEKAEEGEKKSAENGNGTADAEKENNGNGVSAGDEKGDAAADKAEAEPKKAEAGDDVDGAATVGGDSEDDAPAEAEVSPDEDETSNQ